MLILVFVSMLKVLQVIPAESVSVYPGQYHTPQCIQNISHKTEVALHSPELLGLVSLTYPTALEEATSVFLIFLEKLMTRQCFSSAHDRFIVFFLQKGLIQ